MEEKEEKQSKKKPLFKRWWFWVSIGITSFVGLGVLGFVLIRNGAVDGGVNVSLKKSSTENSTYLNNIHYKTSFTLFDFNSVETKARVSEDKYVYYDVTVSFKLSCQFTVDGKNYNDDRTPFYTKVVFYSTDNTSFTKVEKTYPVNSGYTYDLSFTVNNVCGGKEKEVASYHYYFGFPEA